MSRTCRHNSESVQPRRFRGRRRHPTGSGCRPPRRRSTSRGLRPPDDTACVTFATRVLSAHHAEHLGVGLFGYTLEHGWETGP
jgi:hypothetical protein